MEKQRELAPDLVNRLAGQLQQYEGSEAEALVVGVTEVASIYLIDTLSRVTCHNDVGFAAIGVGAWHAKAALMQAGYCNTLQYAAAFALTYAAKKRAEIAPGVGKQTDFHLITRAGWTAVQPEFVAKAKELHEEFERKQTASALEAIKGLNDFLGTMKASAAHTTAQTSGKATEKEND